MMKLTYSLEEKAAELGYRFICGIDEAGRGPLAGNVVAAACILPIEFEIDGLNDSKKLSPKKRDAIFDIIKENAVAFSIAQASPAEIDKFNILAATMLAMNRAVEGLKPPADFALIDGNTARGFSIPHKTVVGGDGISPSIAAASVLAKVTRDRQCLELDSLYPEYGFARHKGYPTREHMEAVARLGPTPEHRMSFLSFLDKFDRRDGGDV